jgi:anthranilate synthase/aminodeoxychorismate synthase-like glutamine amidotransferase
MQIIFIDHYDSFSYNVLDWLRTATDQSFQIKRIACDDEVGLAKLEKNPVPVVISPGPGHPQDYPRILSLLSGIMHRVPILGICLGHQMIGVLAGGQIEKATDPWHGTTRIVKITTNHWITNRLPIEFSATMYNSLAVVLDTRSPGDWIQVAEDSLGDLMILAHKNLAICGVQFHPESFASTKLDDLARNFFDVC